MKLSARLVLRGLSLLLGTVAGVMWWWAWRGGGSAVGHNPWAWGPGLMAVAVGLAGPVRVLSRGGQLPREIRRTVLVAAVVLPVVGLVLLVAGWWADARWGAWAFFSAGAGLAWWAVAGPAALARTMPASFLVGEMVGIIRSAGLVGDRKASPMDTAFRRWTQGQSGVAVGAAAPDGEVVTLDGQVVRLSSFWAERVLVLNFGSYSCPHHRKRLPELAALMATWGDQGVAFLTVYTAEAHAQDGWNLEGQYREDAEYTDDADFCFPYATDLAARRDMAVWLVEKKPWEMPVVLDEMSDRLLRAYNSWPIRLYIVAAGMIVYCGDQGPFGYQPAELDPVLRELTGR